MTNYNLYECKSDNATNNAQRNLSGKSHYVDPDTLRYHKSRIQSCHVTDNGLLLAIVESCAADMDNRKRVFRHVIFDVLGSVLSRPDFEASCSTSKAATKAMWAALNAIDARQVTLDACKRDAKYSQESRARILAAAMEV